MYFGFVVPRCVAQTLQSDDTTLTVGGKGDGRHGVHAGLRDVLEVHRDVPGRGKKRKTRRF